MAKCILQLTIGTKLHVYQNKLRQMGITFVINTGRSFVYRVGPTKSWLVMCHIVISMEKPVFMEIVRNPKDAPVILAGKVSFVTNVYVFLVV